MHASVYGRRHVMGAATYWGPLGPDFEHRGTGPLYPYRADFEIETKAIFVSFEALQYRQDLLPIAHYQKRTYNTRCSENHNNTCAKNRKIRGLKFDTL